MKSQIKALARRFGYEIRQAQAAPDLFHNFHQLVDNKTNEAWSARLLATGPMRTVMDVGANVGDTVQIFRRAFPGATVYAFEPTPSTFAKLKGTTQSDPMVKLFDQALGEKEGTIEFHENVFDATNSVLKTSVDVGRYPTGALLETVRTTTVPVTRLDVFCRREGLAQIDLLKLDVQGYERQVLAGAGDMLQPETIRGLYVEVLVSQAYENQCWADEIIGDLRRRGYRLFGLTGILSDENGWQSADAMFIGAQY